MSIEIKDLDTERLVRELARRLNVEPVEAVRRASQQALARDGEAEDEAISRIISEVRTLPVSDARSIDEILGDEGVN